MHWLRIKKLDWYVLKNFMMLFFVTFFICLFVFLMQFLWIRIDDLVGKGLDLALLGEFFFYSALSLVPMSLPLAILLASLMTFGNFGERLELLSMKSAGISLFRIMMPLLVLMVLLSVGAFVFSNNVMPYTQKKLWSLIFSIRHKSPELEIPAGEFYSNIKGLNIYVRSKDNSKKLLYDIMIYDFSEGFNNATVMTADSAQILSTADKMNLMLVMYDGESFENLKKQGNSDKSVPYRRETFKRKQILLDFDGNLNRIDENALNGQHVCKNVTKLSHDIDSARLVGDSIQKAYCDRVETNTYFKHVERLTVLDTAKLRSDVSYNHDSLFYSLPQKKMEKAIKRALSDAEVAINEVKYNESVLSDNQRYVTKHSKEWHKKFTLSFACIIFFFIGAPLGAIVRKGGLGMPVVISVVLFIFYYIIDNTGQKMATEGIWPVWLGVWFSSLVLLPLGLFFTYKAAKDAEILNPEKWKMWMKALAKFMKRLKEIVQHPSRLKELFLYSKKLKKRYDIKQD